MNKAKVSIRTSTLVMDIDDAVELFKVLNKISAETLDYDFIKADAEKGTSSRTVYYVTPITNSVELTSVNAEDYAMMKLYASTRGGQS